MRLPAWGTGSMSVRKRLQPSQDLDAGVERQSPGPGEPHREHDTTDRGGVYAREEERQPVHPKSWPRKEIESKMPPPSDPDDPVGST